MKEINYSQIFLILRNNPKGTKNSSNNINWKKVNRIEIRIENK